MYAVLINGKLIGVNGVSLTGWKPKVMYHSEYSWNITGVPSYKEAVEWVGHLKEGAYELPEPIVTIDIVEILTSPVGTL